MIELAADLCLAQVRRVRPRAARRHFHDNWTPRQRIDRFENGIPAALADELEDLEAAVQHVPGEKFARRIRHKKTRSMNGSRKFLNCDLN